MNTAIATTVELPGYRITECLYDGSHTQVYRAVQEASQRLVAIKVLKKQYPHFDELLRFRNQYTIGKQLSHPGLVSMIALVPYGRTQVMVMEDMGGISLAQYIQSIQSTEGKTAGRGRLPLVQVVSIGVQLANVLHYLGEERVIHKDIKPANILIHPQSKQVRLIDFSISSLLPKETQEVKNPNGLEGTLAYLAPEQTGRMNRGVDYRADFYTLGVTLFELLTGQLPFGSKDAMALVHAHLAKQPPQIRDLAPAVPDSLAAIVHKLMAKNAEDRYQSALGLKHDLETCLYALKETGQIAPFEIGRKDWCDRFTIPEKLYGREPEVERLLTAFERVSQGASELMLVAGFSGIGKTAVVNELHKPLVRQRGYFIKGKFDQFNRNVPFSAFVQAFRDLVGLLLSESDTDLQTWKTLILEALGENAQIVIDLVPGLETVLGAQPAAPELSGTAAQHRFNLLFQRFIQVFATAEHPLVIFVDDLQWADSASLKLIQVLIAESRTEHLLLLGAYRDNEVSPAHPLMLTLNEMNNREIHTLTLAPLTGADINQLAADTLLCSAEIAQPLSELIYQKTKGNPFFATQFLQGLHQDKYISFEADSGYWQCDFSKVRQASLTDDVVEFMVRRLQLLPPRTQEVLKIASCIGNCFELKMLAVACDRPQEDIALNLWPSLQAGLIVPENETYKFFQHSASAEKSSDSVAFDNISTRYRFLHDRVQQAGYALIPDSEKQATHVQIGELLLARLSIEEQDDRIFEVVNHLNKGIEIYLNFADPNSDRCLALFQLNLTAGKRAKAATAYSASVSYFETARKLLPPDSWQSRYEESLEVCFNLAEAQYLSGDFQSSLALVETIVSVSSCPIEQANAFNLAVMQCTLQGNFAEALQYGQKALACLNFELSEANLADQLQAQQQDIDNKLKTREIEQLIDEAEATDLEQLTIVKILNNLFVPAYVLQKLELYFLITLLTVSISLEHGMAAESGYGFASYGMFLGEFLGDYPTGYKFGVLGQKVAKRFNQGNELCKVCYLLANNLVAWVQHLRNAEPIFREGLVAGLESGELIFSGNILTYQPLNPFYAGDDILEIKKALPQYLEVADKTLNYQLPIDVMTGLDIWLSNILACDEDTLTEAAYIARCESNNSTYAICHYWILKAKVLCLYGRYEDAIAAAQDAEEIIGVIAGKYQTGALTFYQSISMIEHRKSNGLELDSDCRQKLEANQAKLKQWAEWCAENFAHKYHLVEAALSSLLGDRLSAIESFDLAIAGAKENGYIQEEALANELVARYYLDWGKAKIAAVYMQEAYYCYSRWGAKAKTLDLEMRYPDLLQPIFQPTTPTADVVNTLMTVAAPSVTIHANTRRDRTHHDRTHHDTTHRSTSTTSLNPTLDFVSVLNASQALSSSIQLDELLQQLTHIILQNSGGDRCALVLPTDLPTGESEWLVRAIATPENTQQCLTPLADVPHLPIKLIQYVKNTQEVVIFNNLDTPLPIVDDYLEAHQPKSVLCLPLLNQGQLRGILYLSNRLTSGAFTRDRILILNFLCTQAAISLENARLYQRVQQSLTDLQEAQLTVIQSEKMSALGGLVAGVAHEINNPVGCILGNVGATQAYISDLLYLLELYEEQVPNPDDLLAEELEEIDLDYVRDDLPKLVRAMKDSGDRIKTISKSLRTFSRADTDSKQSFNVNEGIESTVLILRHRLKPNEHRPAIEVVADYQEIPAIDCFPGQLNQVFMNILANAIDALDESSQDRSMADMQANPLRITIQTTVDNKQIKVSLGDNGPGMPEAVKRKIFDHLFTTKAVGKGTGLGLAIAQKIIVEAHGGTIAVQSEPGQGTEFCIRLPFQSS